MAFVALQTDCKKIISNLKYLNNDELDQILNDNSKTEALLHSLDQTYLKDISLEKETIIEQNRVLAEGNLAKEPQLVEGRQYVEKLSADGEELSNRVKEKYNQMRQQSGDVSLETALALLQTAASELEEDSENTTQSFLNGDIDLEQFLDQFLTKRKLLHLRQLKAEKMIKIISRDPLGGSNYANTPPMAINTNYFPGIPQNLNPNSVPYPTGGFYMPMPHSNFYPNNY
nr:vacuolar protein sorting-associated protein 37B [Onthophagus taurus]